MSNFAESLIQKEPWNGLMMGNHALVRAMVESGTMVVAAYPGSPTPEIADALQSVAPEQRPYHFEWSTNEKVALETAFGASLNGHLSCCFFKSVGLNVTMDSCVQLSMMRCEGGLVIILGDDPGANSSQNEQDNRHISRMAYIPMFEPGTPTEAYRMYKAAAELSARRKLPVFLRMTTHVCHAREVIKFDRVPDYDFDWTPKYEVREKLEYWPITAAVFPLKLKAMNKVDAVAEEFETSEFVEHWAPYGAAPIGGKRLGIITAAIPAYSVLECLDDNGASVDILKLGVTYPLPMKRILEFIQAHDEVLILEELDRVIELEIKSAVLDAGISSCKIRARGPNEQLMREFTPQRTWGLLSEHWPDAFPRRKAREAATEQVAPRLAQMCPGCGHRSAFYAIHKLLYEEYDGKDGRPGPAITVADIGCHTLGSMEPYDMGTVLLCMGHSNGTGAGLSIRNENRPVVTFIGDSTFYHAGLPAIINAIAYNHDMTLVVMENYTTAMTGHQPVHGHGDYGSQPVNIPQTLEDLGCKFVRSVDAYMQGKLTEIMREAIDYKGFSVVIAKHVCMLKFTREKIRKLSKKAATVVGGGG